MSIGGIVGSGSASAAPEGTAVLSTGETLGTKFLREDGDGTSSWQAVSAGDFQSDGSVGMTGALNTDVGTFTSDVANGATAVGFSLATTNTFSTAGSNLLRLSNGATPVLDVSFQGGIDHVNSGASTAAHSQSLNLNWAASSSQTSSGVYSAVIGQLNTASGNNTMAVGQSNTVSADWTYAFGSANTVSSTHGFAYGLNNSLTTQSWCSMAVGEGSTVTGRYNLVAGYQASAANRTSIVMGAGKFGATGDAQIMTAAIKCSTTDATQTTMQAAGDNYVIPADTTWAFSALVVARSDEADGNLSVVWRVDGCLTRDESNNTALVGSPTVTKLAESAVSPLLPWAVVAEADDTNEALAIKCTGQASTNIRWVAKVDIAQVTYA